MDFARSNPVLLPATETPDRDNGPQSIAVTAAAASAAISAGALAYTIGKDLVPKLQSVSPLVVQIFGSSPYRAGEFYHLDIRLTNLSANSLYIEEVIVRQGRCNVGEVPKGGGMDIGSFGDPDKARMEQEDRMEKTFGTVLPFFLKSTESREMRVRTNSKDYYNGSEPMKFGKFVIRFSDLGGVTTETSDEANFRLLNLPQRKIDVA